ncbi:MAG: hypothetical protein CMN91_02195 [Synechococcus sp. ARS1019]|nr:hypothetical protein [Synechococcus sp. ARS1019]
MAVIEAFQMHLASSVITRNPHICRRHKRLIDGLKCLVQNRRQRRWSAVQADRSHYRSTIRPQRIPVSRIRTEVHDH